MICILCAVFIAFAHLNAVNHVVTSDEVDYGKYALEMERHGISQGFRNVVDWYAASEQNRSHPSPTRVGFTVLLVFLFKVIPFSYFAVACVSFAAYLLFLFISFYYSSKFFGKNIGIGFLLLLSASPIMMAMGTCALTDSLGNLLWGTAIWLFLEYTKSPQRKTYIVLIAVLAWALLVREATVVLVVFLIGAGLVCKYLYRGQVSLFSLMMMALVPMAAVSFVYFFMLGMDGGYFVKLIGALYQTHFTDQSNDYAVLFSVGPWYKYIVDFMLMAPAATLFAIGYAFHLVAERKNIAWEKFFLLFYLVGMLVMFNVFQHSKVVRFVINLDMVLCLFAVFMVYEVFKEDVQSENFFKVFLTLLMLYGLSVAGFYQNFVAHGRFVDPISRDLLIGQKFIPSMKDMASFLNKTTPEN